MCGRCSANLREGLRYRPMKDKRIQPVQDGLLRVVGTPIGNLSDISERVIAALRDADVVACEDTRRCGQLYHLMAIKPPKMVSYYKDNERARVEVLVGEMQAGKTVVLVSDSGMPGVSDPGAVLVAAAREAGVKVEVVPGPSAVVAAVAGSGFAGGFVFAGFLPRKGKERKAWMHRYGESADMVVIYESPYRVKETTGDILEAWGNRRAWLARELTKMHEEWIGPDVETIHDELVRRKSVKGECVLVIAGA